MGHRRNHLVIVPGLASPDHPAYAPVYKTIRDLADSSRAFHAVTDELRWPGQLLESERCIEELTFLGAVQRLELLLDSAGAESREITLLARSFGCSVVASVLKKSAYAKLCRQVIFWGPPPYWMWWETFVENREKYLKAAAEKGCRISASLPQEIEPIEASAKWIVCPVRLASGELDKLAPPAAVKYLAGLFGGAVSIAEPLMGAGHEVTAVSGEDLYTRYGLALFGAHVYS